MTAEPLTCELDRCTKTTLKMYLFKNVGNVEEIRNNVIKSVWNCAVIKPNLVLDPFQVVVAANKAAVAESKGTLTTKTVYAEILFNLSLSKNITQSLSKFGVEKDSNLIVCFLVRGEKDDSADVLSHIEGEMCPIDELCNFTDIKDVRKTYKLDKINADDLLDNVINRIVTKSFVSH